jgi:hypothetical protein
VGRSRSRRRRSQRGKEEEKEEEEECRAEERNAYLLAGWLAVWWRTLVVAGSK